MTVTYAFLETEDGGTHVEIRVAKPKRRSLAVLQEVCEFEDRIAKQVAALRQIINREPMKASAPMMAVGTPELDTPNAFYGRASQCDDGRTADLRGAFGQGLGSATAAQ
jgi:hypothetical protein